MSGLAALAAVLLTALPVARSASTPSTLARTCLDGFGSQQGSGRAEPGRGARAHARRAAKSAKAKAPPRSPSFVVVVDPGHGGDQDGAVSPDGVREKDVTLQIAQKVAAQLRKRGMRAVLTRTSDLSVPLANRPAIANAIKADVFLSIHLNSMATAEGRAVMTGVETYFLSAGATDERASAVAARENADRLAGEDPLDPADPVAAILDDLSDADSLAAAQRLASGVQEKVVAAAGSVGHGVKQAPFYVLAGARMPAVLLEVGFISHPEESKRVVTQAYQDRVADAIAQGVDAYRQEAVRVRR